MSSPPAQESEALYSNDRMSSAQPSAFDYTTIGPGNFTEALNHPGLISDWDFNSLSSALDSNGSISSPGDAHTSGASSFVVTTPAGLGAQNSRASNARPPVSKSTISAPGSGAAMLTKIMKLESGMTAMRGEVSSLRQGLLSLQNSVQNALDALRANHEAGMELTMQVVEEKVEAALSASRKGGEREQEVGGDAGDGNEADTEDDDDDDDEVSHKVSEPVMLLISYARR
ncbi:hypothetical protein CONPUDRAFT_73819 [Coniophora puteana RWD-64-598 SS2]|uniref:Uncharacterized protein n=1 Tax=Coniophora puteana (strain RWD-64-598) TaxID=741705 RepID=A0A5M3MP06_CONPW|nr:uncharacterized protein CONPUDRAFT_73819 [Coniophora puteana RWD-64-598 SS2]EIW80777.1 hypothetical protein CONPUDRAFT_73819 [Coniophora puteana RWD-64-598 SS2]